MRIARSSANALDGRLDRPGGEHRGPGLGADLVDAGQPVQEAPQRGVGGDDVGQVLTVPVEADAVAVTRPGYCQDPVAL